ncbi:hypothetical protein CLOM_g6295 [Closterium sp. NIES-68]|nr:hypothetical protein CLOM_g6295 [Closterium sp. NIES-68]
MYDATFGRCFNVKASRKVIGLNPVQPMHARGLWKATMRAHAHAHAYPVSHVSIPSSDAATMVSPCVSPPLVQKATMDKSGCVSTLLCVPLVQKATMDKVISGELSIRVPSHDVRLFLIWPATETSSS